MAKWENKTDVFSEERRHYKNMYLEISEVIEDKIEVSLFSCKDDMWEIYVCFDIMAGIVYVDEKEAYEIREQIKKDIEEEYEKNGEPSDDFINEFGEKYNICIPDDLYFNFDFEKF